jgi:hypothetical protein
MADALSRPTGTRNPLGASAIFHLRVQVWVFTHQHFRVGRIFDPSVLNLPVAYPRNTFLQGALEGHRIA